MVKYLTSLEYPLNARTALKICRGQNMQIFSPKVTTCNHQADSPLNVWGLISMSDLVICKFRKSVVIHETECPY